VLHSRPSAQTTDWAGKACKDKHSNLLQTLVNYGYKSFMAMVPGLRWDEKKLFEMSWEISGPGNPYCRGKLSTGGLLVLTSSANF
jgi:hypothetical protein